MKKLFDLFCIKFIKLTIIQIFVNHIENIGTFNALMKTFREVLGLNSSHKVSLAWSIIALGDVKHRFDPFNLSQHHFFLVKSFATLHLDSSHFSNSSILAASIKAYPQKLYQDFVLLFTMYNFERHS